MEENQEQVEQPFGITFRYKDKYESIILDNSDDIFKVASIYKMMLLENGIPFKIKTHESDSN